VGAFFIFILISVFVSQCRRWRALNGELRREQFEAYKDSTVYFKNRYLQEVASKKAVVGQLREVQAFYNLDSIALRVDTRAKEIEGYANLIQSAISQIPPASAPLIVYRDKPVILRSGQKCPEVAYMQQRFKNPYYDLFVRVGDSAYADLSAYDTLTLVQHRDFKRKFLRKEWHTTVSVVSSNPAIRNTVVGAAVVKPKERVNYLDVRLQGGLSSYGLKPGAFGGGEVEYTRGKVSAFMQYNRSLSGGNKDFIITGAKFRLIRL
jgi:hypothetical protein